MACLLVGSLKGEIQVERGLGRGIWVHLWEWAQSGRTCASQVDNHLRAFTMEEALNNHVDDGGVSQSLSAAI